MRFCYSWATPLKDLKFRDLVYINLKTWLFIIVDSHFNFSKNCIDFVLHKDLIRKLNLETIRTTVKLALRRLATNALKKSLHCE